MNDIDDSQLALAANEHWRTVYEGLIDALGGEWRRFGTVDAFVSPSVPAHFANGLLVLDPAERDDVARAIEWVRSSTDLFSVRMDSVRARDVLDVPETLGLERHRWLFPGMVLKPIPQPPAAAPGVTTSRVDGSNYDDFIQALVDMGMPPEFARSAFGEATLAAPDVELFVAYLDGRPVGNSVLVRSGDVSGVYSVAVVDSARRRGVGSAVTWAAIDHARGWDSEAVFLQSTEQGYGVYSAMGFRTIVEYAWFALPRPDDTPTRE